LPSCEGSGSCVDLKSEFETIQHELNLTMPYTAGILVNIDQDTALEKEMVFTKKVDSDLLLKVLSINENATYTPGNLTDMTAI